MTIWKKRRQALYEIFESLIEQHKKGMADFGDVTEDVTAQSSLHWSHSDGEDYYVRIAVQGKPFDEEDDEGEVEDEWDAA